MSGWGLISGDLLLKPCPMREREKGRDRETVERRIFPRGVAPNQPKELEDKREKELEAFLFVSPFPP